MSEPVFDGGGRRVVVVGAGPVGTTAALTLARRGFDVTVLEELAAPSSEWRASTFHPPTLEVARELGLVELLLARGLICRSYQVRDRTEGILAEFDYALLDDETPFPFRLQLEQYKYVEIMTGALAESANVRLVRGQRVRQVAQSGGRVVLAADGPAGRRSYEADFVVAADGAHSETRRSLGIRLEGETYAHRYLVISLDAPVEELVAGIGLVNYIADPDEHLLLLRIPDLWRVILSVPPEISDDEALSAGFVSRRLELLTSRDVHDKVEATRIYSVHQRVASRFLEGNIALVGDAAHINSPMGGMGLNSGIHDAYDLGETLARVAAGEPPDALGEWAARRRRVAMEEIRRITHESTSRLAERRPGERAGWHRQMARIADDPERARQWLLEASMVSSARRHGGVPVGAPAGDGGAWRRFVTDTGSATYAVAHGGVVAAHPAHPEQAEQAEQAEESV